MKSLTIAILLCLSTCVTAQDRVPPRLVRVVGTAEIKVVPDKVVIEIGVEKQSPSAVIAKRAADDAMRKVLEALRSNGVSEKDIQTTNLSLRPQYDYKSGRKLSHFSAEQSLSVVLRDITKVDTLLDAVIAAGANQLDSIQYETSNLRKYRDQARDEAVRAAREKAEALATALGQHVGEAYSIDEMPQYNYQWNGGLTSNAVVESGKSSYTGATTAAGESIVKASVTVAFDLN